MHVRLPHTQTHTVSISLSLGDRERRATISSAARRAPAILDHCLSVCGANKKKKRPFSAAGARKTTYIFFDCDEPPPCQCPAAGGKPQTPKQGLAGSWQAIDPPAAHSAGLLIITRGTCCEARACSKPRGAQTRSSLPGGGRQKERGKEAERRRLMFQAGFRFFYQVKLNKAKISHETGNKLHGIRGKCSRRALTVSASRCYELYFRQAYLTINIVVTSSILLKLNPWNA